MTTTERSDCNSILKDAPVLVLGGTGLAGRAIVNEGRRRGFQVLSASRNGSDIHLDITDLAMLNRILQKLKPGFVINAAAEVIVDRCEHDPGRAWCINARPLAALADHSLRTGMRIVHISTDHFFSGDGQARHDEMAPLTLLNEYARTKYVAEVFAARTPYSAILRTNIVGFHPTRQHSLAHWALKVIESDLEVSLFDDQYVSSIDIWHFADCVWDIGTGDFCGLINVASRDVFSKADFVLALAKQAGRSLTRAKIGSVGTQSICRPDSLGLDITKVEKVLGRPMPGLHDVTATLYQHACKKNWRLK